MTDLRATRLAGLVAVALAAACSSAGPPPTNVAFDRPGRFVFACFDVSTTPPTAHTLDYCNPSPVDGTFAANHDLHAIVLQTARGQLGLVDVQPLATSALIDSNPTVPGYTFLAIGDQPVDVVATDDAMRIGAPLTTYVAHRGSRDVWWIGTGELRRVATTLPWHVLALDAEPTSMALSPNEDYLFVALADLGVVRQFHISPTTGDLEMPTDVLLSPAIPAPVTLAAGDTLEPPWEHVCAPVEPPLPTVLPPRTARRDGMGPTPSRLVVQRHDQTTPGDALIVADSSLPVLHVIPIGSAGLDGSTMRRYNVGTPTTDAVITPSVPANTAGPVLVNRYVYALDDHGDVMAVDWTDGAPTQGMVLPLGSATSRAGDRVTFGTPASALGVLSPGFPDNATVATPYCAITAPETKDAVPVGPVIGATHLRGVFLAVGLFDGSVRIVDVWDNDAFCRGAPTTGADPTECAVASGSDPTDATVFIRRHRPRVGSIVTTEATLSAAPTYTIGATAGAVDGTGSAGPGLPSLLTMGAALGTDCGGNNCCTMIGMTGANVTLGVGYPPDATLATTDALVCVGVDPWSTLTQGYTVTYEGPLAGTSNGRFSADGTQFFSSGFDFCAATVLGSAEAATAMADPSYANGLGDQLVITSLPPAGTMRPECDALTATPSIAFEIVHSYPDGHLDLGAQLDPLTGDPVASTGAATCFTEVLTFEVRPRGTWAVYAGASGFLSRVQHGATDADPCTVDLSDASRGLESRATTGQLFVNREVAFAIGNGGGADIVRGSTLTFGVGGQPGSLAVTVGVLPVAIRFSSVDQKMYVVDPVSQGLTRVLLDGYTIDVQYSNQ